MRLSVNKDKLEELFNRRRNPDKASRCVFPYKLASQNSKFSLAETAFLALRLPILVTVFCEGLHAVIVVDVGVYFYLHRDFPLRLIIAFYRSMPHQITEGFYFFLTAFPILFVFSLLLSLAHRWAWNRRADRLNREAAAPQAVPAILPGAWPPPPTQN